MNTSNRHIPKIIHQTGPSDFTKWHPLWFKCQKSWQDNHPDFEYRFWSDEDIDELVQTKYPEFWNMYSNFPAHIMKIDFARFAILHQHGGIYADLDFYCYKNFHNEMNEKTAYIVENPFGNDPFENSLMCSVPGTEFFYKCMELSLERYEYTKRTNPTLIDNVSVISKDRKFGLVLRPYIVFFITGTQLLSSVYRKYPGLTGRLPGMLYNNNDISYHPEYRTKHIHTGLWGQENIEIAEDMQEHYQVLRNIPVEQFDFYYDYSNGNYMKENVLDIHKNDNEPQPLLEVKYVYS
jgi:mannosyltransferase OCH1-like enzyme